jgi:hypothetical protein
MFIRMTLIIMYDGIRGGELSNITNVNLLFSVVMVKSR